VENPAKALLEKGNYFDIQERILAAVEAHDGWRTEECINLHAGKNVMSRKARTLLASPGLVDHSVSGAIGRRNATGMGHIDTIESLAVALLQKLFRAKYVEYRPMSGNLANGIALCALTNPGDSIMVVPRKFYGHYSWQEGGYPSFLGLKVKEIPFADCGFQVDIDAFRRMIPIVKPKAIIVGSFIHLFPIPLAEIRELADSVSARIMYDGAHVMGLIAAQSFQDPIPEGAHLLVGSTQKTLPGPIGGLLICNDDELFIRVAAVTSSFLSNYGNNRIAALAMSAAEMLQFGKEYAIAILDNARTLAEALDSEGLKVLHKSNHYTASHQVILDATVWGGAKKVVSALEKGNIMATYFPLTADHPHLLKDPNGVRFGVSAVTRLGMGRSEMVKTAAFIKTLLAHPGEGDRIGREVRALASRFRKIHYSFDS